MCINTLITSLVYRHTPTTLRFFDGIGRPRDSKHVIIQVARSELPMRREMNGLLFILLLWLPTYLHHTFNVPLARVGHYSIIPWIATFFTISFSGWLADALIARGLSVGTVRKAMHES